MRQIYSSQERNYMISARILWDSVHLLKCLTSTCLALASSCLRVSPFASWSAKDLKWPLWLSCAWRHESFQAPLWTSSDFVPRIMATSVPLPPRPARLVTTVYNSPQLKEVSSIQRLGPMFCLNRTYSVAWSNWSHCLYALINSLYCEVNCFPFTP